MDYNESNLDPNMQEFYKAKQKQNRVPSHVLSQHQQQQLLYHQHQHAIKQRQTQAQIYYHKADPPSQVLPVKQFKPNSHRPVDNSHASSSGSNTNTGTGTSLKAKDLLSLLKQGLALLPGGRDKRGGPVLCFPSNSRADELEIEELYVLVRYLTFLPDDNVKKLKFSVVIDMRSGTTFHSVKPILKVLEECIGSCTEVVFIIKPDKFLEKQKAQMACSKFMFDIQIVSVNTLYQEIDQSQLTKDFDGHLPYNNEEWIQIRICLEDFFTMAHEMSDKFSSLYKFLERKDTPDSVAESKRRLEEHKTLRQKIIQAPVPVLEAEGDKLSHWLRHGLSVIPGSNKASWVTMNPDYQQLIPQVKKTVQQLYEYRAHLQHKWESGRSRLEQIYQLRLFEDDIGRMSDWLNQQRHLFLTEYHDIGQTASQAADLYAEHRQFLVNCSDVREQVSRLTGVANMLEDSGHFASQQIQAQARKLEHDWKSFTTALEDRSNVLQLSASFHARAEAFLANCPHWETAMKQQQPGQEETVNSLSQCIGTLQQLWEEAQNAHEEVCSDGRALANHLSSPVPRGSHTSLAAAVDYSEGRKHCTHLMHELWACFKRVETVHANRKKRLTARLSLLMFREDVGQVLSWLDKHGEPFLNRHTAVGKTLQRAEQLYNGHMQFEEVAANTLTNADKLIAAADDLVAQAHSPEEILQEETELERRIKAFTKSVESRRNTLDLAVGFHNHTKDLFRWFHQLKENHNSAEMLPFTIDDVEDELRRFHNEKRQILDSAEKVLQEGAALCSRLVEDDEKNHFKVLLLQVSSDKETASDLLTERQVRLDLCLQLRLFEADVASAMDCLKHEVPNPTSCNFLREPRLARSMSELEEVTATFLTAIKSGDEVIHKGAELGRAFESVGVNFPAGGSGSNDSGVVDSAEYAVERIQRLIYELTDLVMSVDEINMKLKIELDWRRLEQQSQQVLTWIGQCDEMLRQTALVPSNLSEAEQLQLEHDKFQPILNEAHPQAVTCAAFAEMYIQQISINLNSGSNANSSVGQTPGEHAGAESPDVLNNPGNATILSRRKEAQNIAELVADQWQKLVYAAEEKHKLLIAAGNWYKTSEQVTSVLRSLEKEYRRAEDWCQNEKATLRSGGGSGDHVTYLGELLSRHFEQKEAFLKACILARRTSEQFTKYLGRQPAKTPGKLAVQDKVNMAINDLMLKEQAVLQAWAARKSRLDECLDFIRLKTDADDLMSHFDEAGVTSPKLDEAYRRLMHMLESKNLNHHAEVIKVIKTRLNSRFANQLLLKTSQISTPTNQVGSAGSAAAVAAAAANAASTKLRSQISTGSNYGSDINRSSMSSTGSGGSGATSVVTVNSSGISVTGSVTSTTGSNSSHPQEKAAKQRMRLISEMITTENTYVTDLQTYLNTYYKAFSDSDDTIKVPQDLINRIDVIFSNIKEIFEFHQNVFLPEIQKYDPNPSQSGTDSGTNCFLPEDIGHCFIRYSNDLKRIYVKYCANKDEANKIMMEKFEFFNELMNKFFSGEDQMKNTMQSYWIKPVQRITKYTIFLKDLYNNCDIGSAGELSEAWESMLEVNKRINDEIHLKDIRGLPEDRPLESLGDFMLMDDFMVWEPRQIIKKGRERRVFLFDVCLLLTKKCTNDEGKIVYQYKSHVLMTECNITEHIEGDQCKFALWNGRVPPLGDYRLVLKSRDLEIKQKWVRALREIMQERIFSFCSVFDDGQRNRMTSSTSEPSSNPGDNIYYVMDNFKAMETSQLSVERNQRVQLLEYHSGEWALVRKLASGAGIGGSNNSNITEPVDQDGTGSNSGTLRPNQQGLVPASLLIHMSSRRCLTGGSDDKSTGASTASVTSSSSGGGAMKKWLRDRRGSNSGASSSAVVRRGSKTTDPHLARQSIPTPVIPAVATGANLSTQAGSDTASVDNILLDNVSEESVDVELPPPMALQDFPVLPGPGASNSTTAAAVTGGTEPAPVDTEPPPPQPTQDTSSTSPPLAPVPETVSSPPHESLIASVAAVSPPESETVATAVIPAVEPPAEEDQLSELADKRASNLTIKESMISAAVSTPTQATPDSSNSSNSAAHQNPYGQQTQTATALPAELDELGMALEKNLRLSRQARQETERYHQAWQQHLSSGGGPGNGSCGQQQLAGTTGTLDSVSSKASRASQESDKALSTSEMSQSSCSGGGGGGGAVFLSSGASATGLDPELEDDSASPILTAPRILELPGNGDERLLGELRLCDSMRVSSRLCSSMLEAVQVAALTTEGTVVTAAIAASCESESGAAAAAGAQDLGIQQQQQQSFTSRCLLLYETGLILLTDVVDAEAAGPTVVRCKHILSLSRLIVKDEVGSSEDGRRPMGSRLLWFCLYEEVSSANQSVMCHVVDPVTPDARARWLAELSQMLMVLGGAPQAMIGRPAVNSVISQSPVVAAPNHQTSFNNSSGVCASGAGGGGHFITSNNCVSKVPSLFQLKTEPFELEKTSKQSNKSTKKSGKSLIGSSSKRSSKADGSNLFSSKKDNKCRVSSGGSKKSAR